MRTKAHAEFGLVRSRVRHRERGFTLLELAIGTAVLLVGVVAVMQLVPVAMQSNQANRSDTTAMVIAQREVEQMVNQPLSNPTFTDADGRVCNLGSVTISNLVVGAPVATSGNSVQIDFTAAPVAGYNFTYADPNGPSGSYEVRWAVVSNVSGGTVISKRFILGARRSGGNGIFWPITIDTLVQAR